ncbi:transposase, partial [uncultured Methanobrevibacter sp.]|uniref:transposase n=1 Tax=uncultured Methanobrevibacter sp. TaxID=253161 RepID=UPI0025F996FE
ECVAVDGTIVKANSNNFRVIKIEEIEFLQNLILDYGGNWCKNSIWYKIHKQFNENKKQEDIDDLINEINDNLNKNALILLKTALISVDNMCYVIDLLDVLKANYDGKHTISLTDTESRWMVDKKGNMGLNYNYQVAVDSKNGMVVGQYLTQNVTDSNELFEMLHEIKIQMGINPKVLVADNGYMDDNVIKYAYENNIRLLIPDRNESSKTKSKNR